MFTAAITDQLEKHMPGWVEGSPEKASLQSCESSPESQSDRKQMGLLREIWWKTMCLPCSKRLSQIEGIDYEEIFSPMIHYETIHLMFAFVALENMYMTGLDVKNCLLYGKLKEEIYMKQLEGFVMRSQPNKVMHLKHALYGLKQASLTWWQELEEFMLTQGFKWASSDAGVFVYRYSNGKIVIALVYVDDAIFLGHNPKLIDRKKHACLEHWECRNTSNVKEFLGMQINKTAHRVEVNQINYLKTDSTAVWHD